MLSAAWTLAQKDLKTFLRDRGALALSLLVPIMLVTVFGWIMAYAFGGSGGMPKVTLHVWDADQTLASQRFVDNLQTVEMIKVRQIDAPETAAKVGQDRLEKLIRDGDAHHILVLPAGYAKQVDEGRVPELKMLRDPGREMEDRIVQLAVMQTSMSQSGGQMFVEGMDRMLAEQGMQPTARKSIRSWMTNIGDSISLFAQGADEAAEAIKASETEMELPTTDEVDATDDFSPTAMLDFFSEIVPVDTVDVSPPDRAQQVTYQQAQSVAGMSVMMLLFALTSCSSVLLAERESGTLQRMFAQPISRNSILLGKFLFVFCVGAVQLTVLFTYGEWIFRVGLFRDPLTLLILSLTWVAVGSAFGMFLAAACRSTKQAESLASLLILLMAALGGCWFPLQLMELPLALELASKSTMTYWAMSGYQSMLWSQLPWHSGKVLVALAWQWGWAAALLVGTVVLYRRNYCRG